MQPRWGTMSSTQVLQHLSLAFQTSLNELPVSPSPARHFDNAALRLIALTFPVRWPKGIAAPPELDFAINPPVPVDFSQAQAELTGVIQRFGQAPFSALAPIHPLFGPLSYAQWMRWGFRHADHHLRQFAC